MATKSLNLTPQQKMALWAVWDYARGHRTDDESGLGAVVPASALKDRYEDKFDAKFKPAELEALADKHVLTRDTEAGKHCYRVADPFTVQLAFDDVEAAS